MRRRRRAAHAAPRIEPLEDRSLPSGGGPTLLVGFSGPTPPRAARMALRALDARVVRTFEGGPSLVELAPGADARAAARRLSGLWGVRYAEPDATLRIDATIPNDPGFPSQWGLANPSNIDIDAPEAWDLTTGAASVVVAVIDSGIDLAHPDFAGRVWVNPGEIPGNYRDDDGNGYIDDVRGWNFLRNNANVQDDDGHGTHVAGTVAAVQNNAQGVSGVAPGVRVMPLKFIDAYGDGSTSQAIAAIYYAVNKGARIINASWGGSDASPALRDAIRYAGARNVLFVTAAGNERVNNDRVFSYPASYREPNLLAVAAIDRDGRLASFSNWGPTTVDLAAPGGNVLSTSLGGGTVALSGTSMAVPHVSGVAALVATREPGLSADQLAARLRTTVKPLASLSGRLIAGGIVDAFRALVNDTTGIGLVGTSAALSSNAAESLQAAILGSDEYYLSRGGTDAGFIEGLYQDLLGRAAGPDGVAAWVPQLHAGRSRGDVARAILASPESRQTAVAVWFSAYLRRATPIGWLKLDPTIRSWGDDLARRTADRDTLRATILGSDEYYLSRGGTDAGFIEGLYQDLLGRAAGPDGVAAWVPQLRAGRSRGDVARAILASPEARQTEVARWFSGFLRRPTPLGWIKLDPTVVSWAGQLAS